MSLSLTPEQEEMVQRKVQSGLYSSASEVVQEAFRLLNDRDTLREIRLQELRRELAIGIEQIENGQVAPLDMDAIRAKVAEQLAEDEARG